MLRASDPAPGSVIAKQLFRVALDGRDEVGARFCSSLASYRMLSA